MSKRAFSTGQLSLGFGRDPDTEQLIEARVALRAEASAVRWRLRLAIIEAIMTSSFVLIGGLMLEQPTWLVVRSALLLGIACMTMAMLAIAISSASAAMMRRMRARSWRRPESRS